MTRTVEATDQVPAMARGHEWSAAVRIAAGVSAGIAAALSLSHFGFDARGFVGVFFVLVLTALALTDIEQRRIPNRIVLPAAMLVLSANIAISPHRTGEWIAAAAGTAAFLLVPALVRSGAMGMGDVKLGLLLGAALGRHVVVAVLVGSIAVWPFALLVTLRGGRAAARGTAIPFGPFLAFGAIVALLLS